MTQLPTSAYDLKAGIFVGDLKLLRRVRSNPKDSPMRRKKWRVKCNCGTEFTIPQTYLIRREGPKTHCGCKNKTLRTIHNREYRIWLMMRVRTSDPKHMAFKDYGGRGIKVCDEWYDMTTGFEKFIAHIGPAPSIKYSVDRINVDGNYEPGNVRWATAVEQAANKRPRSTTSSS